MCVYLNKYSIFIILDPDSTVEPGTEEPCEEGEMSRVAPALERLWALRFELARGRTVTSMVWNKKNPVTQGKTRRPEHPNLKAKQILNTCIIVMFRPF